MAEVTRVLREVQLDTEGVPARGSVPLNSRRRSKFVKDDSAAVGATKADRKLAVARNKGVGTSIGEIGVANAKLASKVKAPSWSDFAATKADADAGNKEAVGCITGEIGVAKAEPGNKEAVGSITGEIGVAKAEPANKEADSSINGEIGVAKAEMGNKEATGTFTCEIGVTKAEMGNKGTFTSEIVVTKAENKEVVGTSKPLAEIENPKEERKAEPAVTKERLPEWHIARIKARPLRKIPPLSSDRPLAISLRTRERLEATIAHINGLVDLEQDCLRQHAEKGYAEIGVDLTGGVKKVFILPN